MRYLDIGGYYIPKHCIYGPRPAEGVLFTDLEWWRITDHLREDEREKEILEVQRAKENAKKDISYAMTCNWTNTLASIKKMGNQKRIEKIEKDKQYKIDQYNEIIRNRKEEQKQMIERVKKMLYEDKDATKVINSGILYSLVVQGRQKQIELQKTLKEEALKKDWIYIEKMKKDLEEMGAEAEEAKMKEILKRKQQKLLLDEQIADKKLRRQADLEELEKQKEDQKNMRIEMDRIEQCYKMDLKAKKDFAKKYFKKSQAQIDFERRLQLEEEEEDEINKIYIRYDRRYQTERKAREAKFVKDKTEQRIKIAEKLAAVLEAVAKAEADRMEAMFQEKELEARNDFEAKERLRKQRLADMLESMRKAEEKKARDKHEREERRKWEMMQAYRTWEVNEEWKRMNKCKQKRMKKETRMIYDLQCRENEERRAQDLKEWLTPLADETGEKEALLKYIDEALDFMREYNLPPYPILKAIADVKKANDLWDEKPSEQKLEESGCGSKKPKEGPMGSACYCFKC